jgi:hypothetical protein
MRWVLKDRGEGKTTELVAWVKEGHQIEEWPFWTRVLLVDTRQAASRVQVSQDLDALQVLSVGEWQAERTGRWVDHVQVAIDDLETVLPLLLGDPTSIELASLTLAPPVGMETHRPPAVDDTVADDPRIRPCSVNKAGHRSHVYELTVGREIPEPVLCPGDPWADRR